MNDPKSNLTNQVLSSTNHLSIGLQIVVMLGAISISSLGVLCYCIYVKVVYTDKSLMALSFYRISIFSAICDISQMVVINALIILLTVLQVSLYHTLAWGVSPPPLKRSEKKSRGVVRRVEFSKKQAFFGIFRIKHAFFMFFRFLTGKTGFPDTSFILVGSTTPEFCSHTCMVCTLRICK